MSAIVGDSSIVRTERSASKNLTILDMSCSSELAVGQLTVFALDGRPIRVPLDHLPETRGDRLLDFMRLKSGEGIGRVHFVSGHGRFLAVSFAGQATGARRSSARIADFAEPG